MEKKRAFDEHRLHVGEAAYREALSLAEWQVPERQGTRGEP